MNGNTDGLVDFGGTNEAASASEGEGDSFVVDFTNVGDQPGFAVIPRGIYDAQVDDCVFGNSQNSGNPMWTMKFEIEGGEFNKRKLFFHMVFAASSMPRTKKGLAVIAPELLTQQFSPKAIADSGVLLGRKLRIRLDIRKYEGSDRNNVRDVLPASEEAVANSFLG